MTVIYQTAVCSPTIWALNQTTVWTPERRQNPADAAVQIFSLDHEIKQQLWDKLQVNFHIYLFFWTDEARHFGTDSDTLTSIGQINENFCIFIHVPQRMNPTDCGNPPLFLFCYHEVDVCGFNKNMYIICRLSWNLCICSWSPEDKPLWL